MERQRERSQQSLPPPPSITTHHDVKVDGGAPCLNERDRLRVTVLGHEELFPLSVLKSVAPAIREERGGERRGGDGEHSQTRAVLMYHPKTVHVG